MANEKTEKKTGVNTTKDGVSLRHLIEDGTYRLLNMGSEVLFNTKVGQVQTVTAEQASYLLKLTYVAKRGNTRSEKPRFEKVAAPA